MVADRQNSAQQLGAEPEIQVTQGVRKPVVARGVQNFDQQWGQCGEFIESGKILTLDQCTKFFEISIVDVRVITPRRACLHSSPDCLSNKGCASSRKVMREAASLLSIPSTGRACWSAFSAAPSLCTIRRGISIQRLMASFASFRGQKGVQ